MENVAYKRKIHVIDRGFQYRLIALVLFVVFLGFIVFTGGLLVYYRVEYMNVNNLFNEVITNNKQVTETRVVLQIILPPLLINNLVIMILLIISGIYYTNRIAGPIYRMEKDIDKVLSGDRSARIKLRRGDHFVSLAEKINELLNECGGKEKEIEK